MILTLWSGLETTTSTAASLASGTGDPVRRSTVDLLQVCISSSMWLVGGLVIVLNVKSGVLFNSFLVYAPAQLLQLMMAAQ